MLNLDAALEVNRPRSSNLTFGGVYGGHIPVYHRWMYKDEADPIKVADKDEEDDARAKGYDNIDAGTLANSQLTNCFWDLEDMSPKQLRCYALEEFDVDLPEEASQELLFQSVAELMRYAPQNRSRLVLMAHTIAMEYDSTLEEIKRLMDCSGPGYEVETESFEVVM